MHVAVVILAAAFLAYTSPYGAIVYLDYPWRWAYWLLTIGSAWAINGLIFDYLAQRPGGLKVLLSSVVATPVVFMVIYFVQVWIDYPVPQDAIADLVLSIWVICLALAAIYLLVLPKTTVSETAAGDTAPPPLLEQLPLEYRDKQICALEADDHYVHVHTPVGRHLHYMRLRDAVALMAGVPGVKVHRSWWVALDAIREVKRTDGKWVADIEVAGEVPVSRSGLAELKTAGVLSRD